MEFYSDSSFIDYVKYNHRKQELDIYMYGNKYSFVNIPLSLYMEFKDSESHGKFYNANIKNIKKYIKDIIK